VISSGDFALLFTMNEVHKRLFCLDFYRIIRRNNTYCSGLLLCPITVSPFITMQHAHFCCMQEPVSSWLQIGHMHGCSAITPARLRCLALIYRNNHNKAKAAPITIKIRNIRIPALREKSNKLNIIIPIPYIRSQRGGVEGLELLNFITFNSLALQHSFSNFKSFIHL
jgi:hypothetical protein